MNFSLFRVALALAWVSCCVAKSNLRVSGSLLCSVTPTVVALQPALAATSLKARSPGPVELFISAFRLSLREGLSGGAAGFVQVITMMWLRTTVTYQYRYGVSTRTALAELYAQGGFLRFYRGVTYAIVQAPLCRFGSVAANEISNILVGVPTSSAPRRTPARQESGGSVAADYVKIVFAATLGSAMSTMWRVLLMPLDTCKTVLQVDGVEGFRQLVRRVAMGDLAVLFQGTAATIVATWVGHSWFLVHNWLDRFIAVPSEANTRLWRAALIGFLASAISDAVTNFIKVVKTVKQAMVVSVAGHNPSYADVVRQVVRESGWAGLFGRGLATRIVSNGLQSMLFTVLWKKFSPSPVRSSQASLDDGKRGAHAGPKNTKASQASQAAGQWR